MSEGEGIPAAGSDVEARIKAELIEAIEPSRRRRFKKMLLAAMGSIPWIGGLIVGIGQMKDEQRASRRSELQEEWLEEHSSRFRELGQTLGEITERLDTFGDEVQERIESPEYLALVRKAFRAWDTADTQEKRDLLKKLLMNAGAAKLVEDDLIRLFIDWIDLYHEAHFQVIRTIYRYPGSTRAEIWDYIHGVDVREDSAEADLFKLLIRDLSTGSVIRQNRQKDGAGRYLRKPPRRSKTPASPYMKSAFDDKEPYVLTALGDQFVHYVMDELVPRIGGE